MRIPERVNLRPLTEADVDVLDRMENDPSAVGEHMWSGFRDPKMRRRRWAEDGCIGASSSMLAIASPDGAMVGAVVWWPRDVIGPARRLLRVGLHGVARLSRAGAGCPRAAGTGRLPVRDHVGPSYSSPDRRRQQGGDTIS